jgi:hypothetical protein
MTPSTPQSLAGADIQGFLGILQRLLIGLEDFLDDEGNAVAAGQILMDERYRLDEVARQGKLDLLESAGADRLTEADDAASLASDPSATSVTDMCTTSEAFCAMKSAILPAVGARSLRMARMRLMTPENCWPFEILPLSADMEMRRPSKTYSAAS